MNELKINTLNISIREPLYPTGIYEITVKVSVEIEEIMIKIFNVMFCEEFSEATREQKSGIVTYIIKTRNKMGIKVMRMAITQYYFEMTHGKTNHN